MAHHVFNLGGHNVEVICFLKECVFQLSFNCLCYISHSRASIDDSHWLFCSYFRHACSVNITNIGFSLQLSPSQLAVLNFLLRMEKSVWGNLQILLLK